MRIYISGMIADDPNYMIKFKKAGHHLYVIGHIPIMPIDLPEGLTDAEYLMLDHILINLCDALYMLTDWTKSEGAMIEHEIAVRGGKKIFYQDCEASEKELMESGIME